jgi:hypothetical protein
LIPNWCLKAPLFCFLFAWTMSTLIVLDYSCKRASVFFGFYVQYLFSSAIWGQCSSTCFFLPWCYKNILISSAPSVYKRRIFPSCREISWWPELFLCPRFNFWAEVTFSLKGNYIYIFI